MRLGKITSSLFVCLGLLMALSASPALAAYILTGTSADFEGAWDTVIVEVNAKYRVYMHHEGNTIEGTMENRQDTKYSGRFTGTYKDGRLYFTYVQPKVGATGDGQFIIASDGSLSGVVWATGEQNKKVYVWTGTPTPSTLDAHSSPVTGGGGDVRTVGAAGTMVYNDKNATTEIGELDPGVEVTVVACPNWSCEITAPMAGFVDEKDLN